MRSAGGQRRRVASRRSVKWFPPKVCPIAMGYWGAMGAIGVLWSACSLAPQIATKYSAASQQRTASTDSQCLQIKLCVKKANTLPINRLWVQCSRAQENAADLNLYFKNFKNIAQRRTEILCDPKRERERERLREHWASSFFLTYLLYNYVLKSI